MDLTENLPDECSAHTKESLSSCKLKSCKEVTIVCQFLRFAPTKFRLNEMFSEIELSTFCTESCFLLTMLNNTGIYP
jgi:hypothetical protein